MPCGTLFTQNVENAGRLFWASYKLFLDFFSKFGSCDPNLVKGTLPTGRGANVLQECARRGATRPVGPTFFVGGGLTSRIIWGLAMYSVLEGPALCLSRMFLCSGHRICDLWWVGIVSDLPQLICAKKMWVTAPSSPELGNLNFPFETKFRACMPDQFAYCHENWYWTVHAFHVHWWLLQGGC
jgi:hypothetical protein